ncbi:S1/P1 nuclease [Parasponia andersonii]|uniref:Aspergillus nuclease S1 n=1 Tax=Parasponia andersonii TaxID=3476 RepID=A0A2P5DCF5_PARAD|nr:S1/P1 nuclease [Parasponia andersonii]
MQWGEQEGVIVSMVRLMTAQVRGNCRQANSDADSSKRRHRRDLDCVASTTAANYEILSPNMGLGLFIPIPILVLLEVNKAEGHYATCKIAEGYLSEETIADVKQLLPASAEASLALVCSWPDDIRQ